MASIRKLFSDYGAGLALLALVLPLYVHVIQDQHHWGGDFSIYISQARNLVEGRPFNESSYVVTAESAVNHPAAYPPVPALLLAPIYAVFGLDYRALKLVLALCAWLSLAFWYRLGCLLGLPSAASILAVLVFALASTLHPILNTVGSDSAYLLVSAAALVGSLWVEHNGVAERRPIKSAFLVSFLMLVCVATRSTGIALLIAWGAWQLSNVWRERTLRPYTLWTGGLLVVFLLFYQAFIYNTAGQYGSQFSLNIPLIFSGAIFYLRSPASLWGGAPAALRYVLGGLTPILAAVALWRTRWCLAEWYVVIFCVMLGVYTAGRDYRYVAPVLPILLFMSLKGLMDLGKLWLPAHPDWPIKIAGGIALLGSIFNLFGVDTGPVREGVGKPSFQEVVNYLKSMPQDTLILSWNPRVLALYTNHPSSLYPQQTAAFENQIPAVKRVVLLRYQQPLDEEKLDPFLAEAKLPVEFSNQEFTLYRIR